VGIEKGGEEAIDVAVWVHEGGEGMGTSTAPASLFRARQGSMNPPYGLHQPIQISFCWHVVRIWLAGYAKGCA